MLSSKELLQAKKLAPSIRQFHKELLDHLYAQAAEAGRYPSPENMLLNELFPLVKVAILGDDLPPQPPDSRDQDVTDLETALGSSLYRDIFHDAVDAYFRHRPELEIKRGKSGPKPNVEQIERILKLHSSKSYRQIAKEELQAVPEGEAKDLLIEKERERIRAAARRARRRSRT